MNVLRAFIVSVVLSCLLACSSQGRAELQAADSPATSNARIVAIGDVHGDFEQFKKMLIAFGLIDKRLNWVGGSTNLVQLGDIPDRGPDSRKAMDLLIKLEGQAIKDGGKVVVVIGNHEAMMMIGDLRFVHPGEYASFKDRNSKKRRKAYYQQTVNHLKSTLPEEDWPEFNREYREAWEARFPLGYVEHRQAWAPTGKYGQWVLSRPAVAQIGETLFAHGGISPNYAGVSLQELNTRVRTVLAMGERAPEGSIVEDENGPLWDRGWVSRLQDDDNGAMLNQILAEYGAKRMVIAHTPIASIIIPRFDGKILVADVGLAEHYGNGFAALEILGDEVHMLLQDTKIPIPDSEREFDAYFDAAQQVANQPAKILRYRQLIKEAKQAAEEAARQAQEQ